MAKKRDPKRVEALRLRKQAQKHRQGQNQRERLFALEEGGSANRPMAVESAAVVETRATRAVCPLCDGAMQVMDHEAARVAGELLRRVTLRCKQCREQRPMWFRIAPAIN